MSNCNKRIKLVLLISMLFSLTIGQMWAGTKRIYCEYSGVSSWWGTVYVYAWGSGKDAKKYTMVATGTTNLVRCDIDDYHTDLLFYKASTQGGSWETQSVDVSISSNNRWSLGDGGYGNKATISNQQRYAPGTAIDGLVDIKNPHNQMFSNGTFSATLEAHKTYEFKILETSTLYGLNDLIATSSISNQTLNTSGYQVRLCTAGAGTYTFAYNTTNHQLSITYPTTSHPSIDYCYVIDYSWSPSANLHVWNGTSTKVAEWNGSSTIAGSTWPGAALSNKTTIGGQSYFYIAPGEFSDFMVSKNGDGNDRTGEVQPSDGYSKRRYYTGSTWIWNTFTVRIQLENNGANVGDKGTEYVDVAFNSEALGEDIEIPVKDGYTFGGYYTEDGGSGTQLISATGKWTTSAVDDYLDASHHWIHAGMSTTIYAKWTEDKHAVSVAVSPTGAGSVQVNSSNVSSVTNVGIATKSAEMTAVPANATWVFKEWRKSSDDVHLDLESYTTTGATMKINATAEEQTLTAVFEPRYVLVGSVWNDDSGEPSGGMPGWMSHGYGADFTFNSFTALGTGDGTGVDLSCSRTLTANTTYKFQIYDRIDGNYGYRPLGDGTAIFLGDGDSFLFDDPGMDVWVAATGAGTYTFRITNITESTGHYYPTVTIERPHQVYFGTGYAGIDNLSSVTSGTTGGTLAVTANESTLSNEDWVNYGTDVTYTPSAATGYTFEGFYSSNEYSYRFTQDNPWVHDNVTGDDNVYAKFEEKSTSVTLANDGHGKVQISSTDKTSTTCGVTTTRELTAVPNDGYMFSSWAITSGDDITISSTSANPTILTGAGGGESSGQTVTANFALRWALKAESDGWGSASFDIDNISTIGGDAMGYVDISLAANTNYQFTIIDKQGSGATYKNGSDNVYYMTNGNSYVWDFSTSKTYNCGITTAGAGTYRFMWNITDKTMSVIYPNFVIYRSGDKSDDPRATEDDVESCDGGTISKAIEFRMKVRNLDMWYTLCLPFTVNAVKVWDEEDGQYYAIEPYYRTEVGATLNGGHYIIRKPKQTIDLPISEFGDWRDPTSATDYVPTKDTAYIIQWHNSYFLNKYVSFFGATGQTIPTSFTAGAAPSADNVVNVHGNNSMQSGSVAGAYLFEADYGYGAWLRSENVNEARTINPFECYVRASSGTTGRFLVIRRGMTIEDTATGWDDVLNSETKEHILVYSLSGICVTQLHDCSLTEAGQRLSESLSEGLYILYAGNESVKLMVGGK